MDEYTRCYNLIVNEVFYAKLYGFLLKHTDEPIVKQWLEKDTNIFVEGFVSMKKSTEEEIAEGQPEYVTKSIF